MSRAANSKSQAHNRDKAETRRPALPKQKWVEGTSPEQGVVEVARRALGARLELVAHYLPLAARRPEEEIEYVHQLRVATRRAVAALKLFAPLLPRRRAQKMKKLLGRIRRAAGDARDLDVLGLRLAERWAEWSLDRDEAISLLRGKARRGSKGNKGRDAVAANERRGKKQQGESQRRAAKIEAEVGEKLAVLQRVYTKRARAQRPIRQVDRALGGGRFRRRINRLVSRIRWRGEPSEAAPCFGAYARRTLRPQLERFLTAARAPRDDLASLHQFRIEGKRLRYAIEVFAGGLPPACREVLYPQVEELQERLGTLNDHVTALVRFQHWNDHQHSRKLIQGCRTQCAFEAAALEQCREQFATWWTPQRAERFERTFGALLAEPAPDGTSPTSSATTSGTAPLTEQTAWEENPAERSATPDEARAAATDASAARASEPQSSRPPTGR